MKTPQKPKYCEQDWLEMKPTNGGRICGQCSKVIVDFSKMTWAEIENIQHLNNNSICGMYSAKQLEYWGREIPTNRSFRIAVTTALAVSLTASSGQVTGQISEKQDTISKTIIKGTVLGRSREGDIDTLGFTFIKLKNSKVGVEADEHGQYQIDVSDYIDTIPNPTIVYFMAGFNKLELKLNPETKGEINFDPLLNQDNIHITTFYVTKPTLGQRIKWKLKKWFGRKEE